MFLAPLQHWLYRHIAKPIFFTQDPERIHDSMTSVGRFLGSNGLTRTICRALFSYQDPRLSQTILGIKFPNPVGLTAGFDKNGELTDIMPAVGFGFEEVGSVTGEYCAGNPKPRLWRLPSSKGLVVYYGLKNDGSDVIAWRLRNKKFTFPVGINIAKTNDDTTIETNAGIADYAKAFRKFLHIADYYAINISCPNSYGGEFFSTPESLEKLLAELDSIPTGKPVFIKFPADLSFQEIDALVAVCDKHRVHGFIATNLTKTKDNPLIKQDEISGIEKGGISGKPVFEKSNDLISHLYKNYGQKYVIIGVGGIFTAEDAYEKIRRGASLVELATGMIFEGPQLIGQINHGLAKLLKRDGLDNIGQAVGIAHK